MNSVTEWLAHFGAPHSQGDRIRDAVVMGKNVVSRPKRSAPEDICGHRTAHREKFDPEVSSVITVAAKNLSKLEKTRSARESAEDKQKAWKILSTVDDAILQARKGRSREEAAEFAIRHKSSTVAELRARKAELRASEDAYQAMKAEERRKAARLERTR